MPRFFFDVFDGTLVHDDEGTELKDLGAVSNEVMRHLPELVEEQVSKDHKSRLLTVLVRDEENQPIYSATISYAGHWLLR